VSWLYPYALLDGAPALPPTSGIAGEPVEILHEGSWIVAAGTLAERPLSDEAHWRVHDRVVRRLASAAEALLPFRFGSAVESLSALIARLEPHELRVREALALVRCGEQMTLRVFGEAAVAAADPALERELVDRPGTRYLEARRRAQTVAGLEPLTRETSRFVRAERVERQGPAPLVASVYHLVRRADRESYLAAARGAMVLMSPLRVSISGPWPPYAFVPEIFS
jgi:hypothetical protein